MKTPDDEQPDIVPEPAPVPEAIRLAWARGRAARMRTAGEAALPPDAVLESLADPDLDDETRMHVLDQLLGSEEGARIVAYLAAARSAVPPNATPVMPAPVSAGQPTIGTAPAPRARTPASRLRPVLLAASLMLVAGAGWYGLVRTPPEDAVRAGGDELQLGTVPPSSRTAPIMLRWKPVRADDRYTVEVLDADDTPVFSLETSRTDATVPAGRLAAGTYRWYVVARGTDGAETRSRVAPFTVR